jgi:hypothetical protein
MRKRTIGLLLGGLVLPGCPAFVHDGGIVYNNPYGVPTRVSLAMPASLSPGKSASYRTQDVGSDTAAGVQQNLSIYLGSTTLINTILQSVASASLKPGQSYTFDDPSHPGTQLTVLLSILSDHAVIAIGQGTSATGLNQTIGISYTSPRKGVAVLQSRNVDPVNGRFYLATTFDLDAGHVSADGASDNTAVASPANAQKVAAHWEFTSTAAATGSNPAFQMQVSAFGRKPFDPANSGVLALSANFLSDGRGAYIGGAQIGATGNVFMLLPNDGKSFGLTPPASHDFYLTPTGLNLPAASASANLKAAIPADGSFYKPFPTDPAIADPFADPKFRFPS